MPSTFHPHYNYHYLCHLLLGFSSFVVLCGVKAALLMRQPAPKKVTRRACWNNDETHRLISLLLQRKSEMGQAASLTPTILGEVAQFLTDKDAASVLNKYQALKRKYRTIDRFKNGTGRGQWSVTHGADISDLPEERQLWDDFMRTSDDAKEMAPHRNTGWLFFVGMEELLSQSSAAEGCMSVEGPLEPELELDYTAQDNESKQYFSISTTDLSSFSDPADAASSQSMLGSTLLPDYNLDLDCLFDIRRDLTSPDPITQFAAIHEALLVVNKTSVASPSTSQSHVFSSAESANRTFSDMPYPRPPSTQTSLLPPSIISSAGISKRSKLKVITQTQNMSTAVAMTGMTGTLNQATDCMKGMQELLVAPTASPFTPPLPAFTQPVE
ncbi:hypothetical protein OG21DRAFT_1482848 [Imleria badia]|nr:hypothetical protein OG21DRAFT_1482848 [Imleria badia]